LVILKYINITFKSASTFPQKVFSFYTVYP